MFVQVAVPLRLPALTYKVPDHLQLKIGDPVIVPVRKKKYDGVIVSVSEQQDTKSSFELKEVVGLSETFPNLDQATIDFLLWASNYYQYPLGEVLNTFLPPNPAPPIERVYRIQTSSSVDPKLFKGKKQKELLDFLQQNPDSPLSPEYRAAAKRLLELGYIEEKKVHQAVLPKFGGVFDPGFALTENQSIALQEVRSWLEQGKFTPALVQGITGSGKTEIYIRSALHALSLGKNVLLVVPEIALTPQLVSRFQSRLGIPIAVLHSGISAGEKSKHWHSLNMGKIRMCIGARSAAFAPMKNLGLIIVDEEHDSALKQEDHLRYNGRDLLVMRAKHNSSVILLGSATPSLETYHNAVTGKYKHLVLPERATGARLPEVFLVDKSKDSSKGLLSNHLKVEMEKTLQEKGQIMLLLNRRGFSSFLLCENCGHVPECRNCSVSLTNYQKKLKCHYCGEVENAPTHCSKCGESAWEPGTKGTEALEIEVKECFPQSRVIRIDKESVEKKGSLEKALQKITEGQVDIVIGTQIISKGHDFPNVSLVGVVLADSSFHLPDFRAAEKSFQLFTQMAGRAGRGNRPGKVLLQTYDPKHPSIQFSLTHDYRGFSEGELKIRRDFQYPPFVRLARVLISGPDPSLTEKSAEQVFRLLEKPANQLQVTLLGPAPAPISKIANRYRWNFLLKAKQVNALHSLLNHLQEYGTPKLDKRVMLQVDVDPLSLM